MHQTTESVTSPAEPTNNVASPVEAPPSPSPVPAPVSSPRPKAAVNLQFLQDPGAYHLLPTDDVAPSFLDSPHQPPPTASLPDLLNGGHYRRAAETAVKDLLQCPPDDAERILQLLYTRLACLILVSCPDLAAQEAVPLTEHLARSPASTAELVPLLPWELRLILVRLQGVATADGGRRGIMALYALAGEVRAHVKQARTEQNDTESGVWTERLHDLGLRVADALVEMGELETANRHLDGLTDVDRDEIVYRKAVLRIRVGDVAGARRYIDKLQDDRRTATLAALLQMADTKGHTSSWQALHQKYPDEELFANNVAVFMLYAGHITRARQLLEETVAGSPASAGVLFNISTIYELCTERAVDCKVELAQRLAEKEPQPASGGWERAGFELKL
ncbi:hypothetical protein LTR53_000071 [Teratosphaeriaceae sp. CCFEE 6253]|nr:hypothetical protein LTR53_000071 [Teratosphaeriaceae sp. CCFEE 6253]